MNPKRKKLRYNVSKLAEAQAARGWTNEDTARAARVHPATVGRVFAGTTERPATVGAIAFALGFMLSDLLASSSETTKRGRR